MPGGERKGLRGRRRYALAGALAVGLVAADQLTKFLVAKHLRFGEVVGVVPRYFNLVLSHNTGGAFSLLAGRPRVFTVLSLVAIVLLGYLFTRLEGKTFSTLATAGVLAGALGNLVDRFRFGYVIDFVDLHIGAWHWYIFNVADAAITIGAIALFISTFVGERRRARRREPEPAPERREET